jgi:hypothetical protein
MRRSYRQQVTSIGLACLGLHLLGLSNASAASPITKDIVDQISAQRIEATIKRLAAFGTRHSLSDTASETRGIGAARRWIVSELERCSRENGGRLQIALDEFTAEAAPRVPQPTQMMNVVATLPGHQDASRERLYVVSGHYDSMPSSVMDATSDAPGANDDASGTAAVMEMACVMSKYSFDATLVFMAVAGEEQGLLGSTHWAKQARSKNLNIAGMFTNDIIGNSRGTDGKRYSNRVRLFAEGVAAVKETTEDLRTRLTTGGENDSPSRELARFVKEHAERHVRGMTVDLIYRRDRYLRGGDHAAFLDQGYAALRFTEASEDFRHQHQNVRVEAGIQYGDLVEFVDFKYVANVAKVNAAALASLALAPAAPQEVMIETVRLENDTTLRWNPNSEPDLAGYRVVWRATTSPYWEHHRDTGDVTRFTLPNVSKDNFVFGLIAIDKEGHASPASYPKPYRPGR